MRLGLAIRVFFKILFDAALADRVREALSGPPSQPASHKVSEKPRAPEKKDKKTRSDALTLLATLQQEARFIDLVKEPLGNYSDAQIGAAARDVLRDCDQVLGRMFHIQPVTSQDEGSDFETPEDFDSARFRLTGNVTGNPPFRGRLVHHGWEATKCELPTWSGAATASRVLAPAELELA